MRCADATQVIQPRAAPTGAQQRGATPPAAGRSEETGPKVALFDLDGTITRRDTYLAYLLGFLARHPRRLRRAATLPFAVALYFARLRDNSWLKVTFLRAVLGGMEVRSLAGWTEQFLDRMCRHGLRPGALEAISVHRAAGHHLVLVTASLHFYAEPLGARLGLDAVICTRAVVDGQGRLTGELEGANCYGVQKLRCAQDYLQSLGCRSATVLYTDHHSDLPLLRSVDRPVAVNPTRQLRAAAARLGIPIEDWGTRLGGTTRRPAMPLT